MTTYPTVTGYIERTRAFIAHFLHLEEQNEHIIASSVLALPAPKNATASTWERDAPLCEKHHTPNFRSLVVTDTLQFGERYCSQCIQDEHEERILQFHTGKIAALFPNPGQLTSRIHLAEVRHNMQEDEAKKIIAGLSTNRDLKKAPEVSLLSTLKPQKPPTGPLPARDIERGDTPPSIESIPTSELPPVVVWDEDYTTEKRPVAKRRDTVEIPAMNVEMLLLETMRCSTHPQSTGENERLVVEGNAWML